mmetsp:Transcript_12814/g.38699  ORF Transcript_12814/g.38699 Transcript_12814/m.38699 type:complete len:525 (-) Transcript_12814:561-2135(-)|eukprot:CAMPEP_0206143060 /NCGR_PEP_ID=MMETSP1473-20131121/19158_1 /ASSEMBLY_ACC=CAM_ASM_001109 /TAXON_ID=1461547 /ORGANISM="Stichococcus sp, Strain RCC1054" /LENGTH=524 /DNA_ID=CAMNT_0053538299 /DNA_START=119 /DNA_END=1693 /DNA_ORIENTATION=+
MARGVESRQPLLERDADGDVIERRSLLGDMWYTGTWRIYPLMFLYVVGIAMIAPQVPGLMTDFMASRRAGEKLQCEDYSPNLQPAACRDAYSDVVWWSTCTSFLTNSVLTFVMAPLVGTWSDSFGRRPFLAAAMLLGSGPGMVLLAHLTLGTSLLFYYPASVMGGAISMISIALAWVADLLPPVHRAGGFGGIMGSFSVGILIGPAIGSMLTATAAAAAGCVCGAICVLYAWLVLPESLTVAARDKAKEKKRSADPKVRTAGGLRILFRSPLFKRLTICLMVSGIVNEGLSDLLIQYFKLLFNFTVNDVTLVFEVLGVCGVLVQTVVLRYMLKWLGEKRVLAVGLGAACLELLAMGLITAKWQTFAALSIGSLGGMAFPAISSIKANNVDETEQGTVQGALFGAKALATGTGPLLFAALFAGFTKTDSPLPYYPGAPFLMGSALMVVAVVVAATLPTRSGGAVLAPLLESDDEADVEAAACSTHFSDLPTPTVVFGDAVDENIRGLLVHGCHNQPPPSRPDSPL